MASSRIWKGLVVGTVCGVAATGGCGVDRAPEGLGRTPDGPGARVRFDPGAQPLPEIPLPNDAAAWPDPTSRTGLRLNASLVAPTALEQKARAQFATMEGWGTFAPLSVSFDADRSVASAGQASGPALDLASIQQRHVGDDYEFENDAVYLINLRTGVPVPLDLGAGNFAPTLNSVGAYGAGDPRGSERNLLVETIDETQHGAVTTYDPALDRDFDGRLDRPNLMQTLACPDADPVCDDPASGTAYTSGICTTARRLRDRCLADQTLDWYERETDTLIVRPVVPMDEMTRYAVVITDRTVDALGYPVRSPFPLVYHAAQGQAASEVAAAINHPALAAYWGTIAGSGLDHVAFLWSFTTQPTVDDLKRLRDGLAGQGPFARFAKAYPPHLEVQRAVGLVGGLAEGATDPTAWETSPLGQQAGCEAKAANLWVVSMDDLRPQLRTLLEEGFGAGNGPSIDLLLRRLDAIDHMVIGTFKVPYLLKGGPKGTDPDAAFDLDFTTGEGDETTDNVQAWMLVPKATERHQQPFNVTIHGHGYTGNLLELVVHAGNMAEHGLATVGINAAGHGLTLGPTDQTAIGALLGSACFRPLGDALTLSRARDLNRDGTPDSGGDFWSSHLFHTRDSVRQSVLDHVQLVRLMRAFGTAPMHCRNDANASEPVRPCDPDGDGTPTLSGDFDNDGTVDLGGPDATYGTWGESLGGILSAIHGAIDPHVTSAVPGSGGGGLADIGMRSVQGGVVEAVLLRLWGPLVVSVPAAERPACTAASTERDRCTMCTATQRSIRWVLPDVNTTGEVEIDCVDAETIANTTVLVRNLDNDEVRCASVDDLQRFRIGVPASNGDRILVSFWDGAHAVESYAGCHLTTTTLRHTIERWGVGRFLSGATSGDGSGSCTEQACAGFQGRFFPTGTTLTSPGDGLALRRQTPEFRRFMALAQAALEPADPVNFAPYYALRPMTDPVGAVVPPHAMMTLNTIGDMNVPIAAGIAQARAAGALPFLRPDQAARYPEHLDYVTPQALFDALGGRTPNRELIERHVVEGVAALARHPADPACALSANAAATTATWLDSEGQAQACFPLGCTEQTEMSSATRMCLAGSHCDAGLGRCVPDSFGERRCEEALWDVDDLDEGTQNVFEQHSAVPLRLARRTASAREASIDSVWAPRLLGTPFAPDTNAYVPQPSPAGRLTALLDAYTAPEGEHTFVNGDPCRGFDHGTYLTHLVARFFQSDGTDLYYLSHPQTHRCLASATPTCPDAP